MMLNWHLLQKKLLSLKLAQKQQLQKSTDSQQAFVTDAK